ncbi:GAF domain-containing protein [Ktedonobacteria bacterium brp13]|nr:GAF domain-containing protein [Ktedonobacteria bacterium brp13]
MDEHDAQASTQKCAEDEGSNARILREVAQITAQSFQSSQEAMRVALEVMGHFLASQTLFIARFDESGSEKTHMDSEESSDAHVLKIIETRNTGTPSPVVGSEDPLENTYCQTVFRTRQPLIVDDVTQHPFYQQLATTKNYHIGSYIGVPLIYSDGRPYGTLCSQDPHSRPLTEQPEKLELMQIVARFLISYIEREELITQVRAAEQVQAELARKEQQARAEADRRVSELEAVFESIGDGLLVSDLQGRFQMNAAARHLLRMEPSHENVQGLSEAQHEDALILDEVGQPLVLDRWPIIRVLRGEHLIGEKVVTVQRVNTLGEKRYLNVSGMPMYDQQGQINGGVCVFRDVTEHYVLERRTQDTLNALLTLAESLAWVPDNAPGFFSAAPSHQTSSLQLACQRLTQLISTLLQCQDVGIISLDSSTATWHLQSICNSAQAPEAPWWQETMQLMQGISPDDSDMDRLRTNEVVMHPLQVQGEEDTSLLVEVPMFVGNDLLGLLALIYRQHDAALTPAEYTLAQAVAKLTGLVYERERLLQEQAEARAHTLALQETNRRFNDFLSIASHELKGPLAAMKVNLQMAQRALRKQEQDASFNAVQKLQRYLGSTEHQIHVQDRLTSDLLDVSRIRAGKLELQKQSCDVVQIVHEIIENQQQIADDRVIHLELPAEKMEICGDADRIGQVVSNYMTNALKYSAFEKPVAVSVVPDGAEVRVTVSDQGPGLTSEEQKHVWERFYRAKDVQVLSGHGIGLGLGLHICKTIVEQHDGRVGLYSTPGQGSHFWFTLPLSTDRVSC